MKRAGKYICQLCGRTGLRSYDLVTIGGRLARVCKGGCPE